MLNHLNTLLGIDREKFISRLITLYEKNPNLLRLIRVMNLEWNAPTLDEELTTDQIIQILENHKKQIIMKNNKQKQWNEVQIQESEKIEFFSGFENPGDELECEFHSESKTGYFGKEKNGQKVDETKYILHIEGVKKYAPSNYALDQKLRKLSEQNYSGEIKIVFDSWQKLDGGKKMKVFKVFTA